MGETADIVVIGAGIMSMSTAFQIARRSGARVIVLEKGVGPGEGSTGASSAVCRFRYSNAEIVRLARDGIAAYRNWPDFLGNAAPNARFQNVGVLWLSDERDWALREAARLGPLGIRAEAPPTIHPTVALGMPVRMLFDGTG
jgi:glycine/D-amino acid oxidase-like deaminating enzyme